MKGFTVAQYKDLNESINRAFWTISYTAFRIHNPGHMPAECRCTNNILVKSYDIASCILCTGSLLPIFLLALKHLPLSAHMIPLWQSWLKTLS